MTFSSQEGMFWQLFPGDVMEPGQKKPVRTENFGGELRKREVVTGRTWTSNEWSQGNEYWQIFVDDRPVPRDATDWQANAQPKAVFSFAMTVMDKICG